MAELEIGRVTHYFGHIGVASIKLTEGGITVGDTIHVKGHTTDFTMTVDSMQVAHKSVAAAQKGDEIGVKIPDHAREHDQVFRVTA
jgi:translation elongation factor EF-1alpha